MRIFHVLLLILIVSLWSCEKEDVSWNLPRTNDLDSLQNLNSLDPNFPVAKFFSSDTSIQMGSSIDFVSTSLQNPTSFEWTFPGGIASSLNESSANVLYNYIGKYDVNLNVANNYGSDSVNRPNFIEVFYLKSFQDGAWDGWVNNGWSFSNSSTCLDCIYAWQNTSSFPISRSITKTFSNVSLNSKLEFFYYIFSPGGTLKVKVNGVDISTYSQYGSNTVSVPLPNLTNFTLTFEATVSSSQTIYLNDIKIRP